MKKGRKTIVYTGEISDKLNCTSLEHRIELVGTWTI